MPRDKQEIMPIPFRPPRLNIPSSQKRMYQVCALRILSNEPILSSFVDEESIVVARLYTIIYRNR